MGELVALQAGGNVEMYRVSTDAASLCKDIVVATAKDIQGRKYVCVEGWQAIAVAHGCAASARDVERVDGGVRAVGEVRRMSDGQVIATAEGFVGEDEATWFGGETIAYGKRKTLPKRADYAIRAMAQTRAISRACRSAFAHVVVMMNAGLQTTPAEEVPDGGFGEQTETHQRPPIDESTQRLIAGINAAPDIKGLFEWKALNGELVNELGKADKKRVVDLFNSRELTLRAQAQKADGFGDVDLDGVSYQ